MLNDFGLSGTFYLNPRGCDERGGRNAVLERTPCAMEEGGCDRA